jgi:hypothetical protein
MNIELDGIEVAPERDLYGKLIGVIQSRQQLTALCESLAVLKVYDVETIDGLSGITQLEKWKDGVSQYIFGDTEGKTLQRYLEAVKSNLIVFVVVVESSVANNAAEIAKSNGATEVTYFGNSVITNY